MALARCIATALVFGAGAARAQQPAVAGRSPANDFELWAGYSPTTTDFGHLGRHTGLTLGIGGIRYNHRISVSPARHVYYTFDAIPFARVSPTIIFNEGSAGWSVDDSRCMIESYPCERSRTPARGVGFNPIGFTFLYHVDQMLQWRLGANGGALWFNEPTPSDLATRFNFTASLEAGVQLTGRNGEALLLVYRMHHLSNAGLGNDNLAMLSHVFSAGVRWR